jgi:hypothetical protein
MSTIASPREPSVNGRRVPLISTPTSSSRPSLDVPRSIDGSPNPNFGSAALPKRNRAALREYYNLKKAQEDALPDNISEASSIHDASFSDVLPSELDSPSFNADTYTKHALETQSLAQLLKTYNGVLTDIRALDAEKKALVYDNYSKLISATETIRKMREGMDPLNPMARTLDPAIGSVYARAEKIKEEIRDTLPEWRRRELEMGKEEKEKLRRSERVRAVVTRVLDTPRQVREHVKEGRMEDARRVWRDTLIVLERWRERGVGGEQEVLDCIEDGEAALRGEEAGERSWESIRAKREEEEEKLKS